MPVDDRDTRLTEDLGAADATSHRRAVEALRAWPTPSPTPAETRALAQRLLAGRRPRPANVGPSPWAVLRAQARVLRRELWTASAMVMALGTLLTWGLPAPWAMAPGAVLPFALLAPMVAAVGVALVYGSATDPASEIELTLPVSPRLLLLARLVLVFGFDLALGLGASLLLVTTRAGLPFEAVVLAWLAPMTFLAALSFFITAVWNLAEVGITLSLTLWAVLNLLRAQAWTAPALAWWFSAGTAPWALAAAALLCGAAVWLGGSEERWLRATR